MSVLTCQTALIEIVSMDVPPRMKRTTYNSLAEYKCFRSTLLLACEGFKDALVALTVMKHPELEHKAASDLLRGLVFDYMLVRPELEGVRDRAWLQAKVHRSCEHRISLCFLYRQLHCYHGNLTGQTANANPITQRTQQHRQTV